MAEAILTARQKELITAGTRERIWLSGNAGCGKTTAAAERVRFLLENTEAWPRVLVFTPGRNYSDAYRDILSSEGIRPAVTTYNSYIETCLRLFWPLIASDSGFSKTKARPQFLTIEAAQIMMAKMIRPRLETGYFASLSTSLSRVFNQVLVAMHKCAAAEIPLEKYAAVMKDSWGGDPAVSSVFDQTQECVLAFRENCLRFNLLDYSLQLEIFSKKLLPHPRFREWLREQQYHIIFDNLEEEVPAAHHFIRELAPLSRSMLLITDRNGGYRSFMGCDPISAESLSQICGPQLSFEESFVSAPPVQAMEAVITRPKQANAELPVSPRTAFSFAASHHYPEMIKKAVNDVAGLIHFQGVAPENIVIIAPLVSDILYTEMERELREQGVRVYLNRPSRPLLNEQVTRSLLTLCELVKPIPGTRVRLLDIVQMAQCFIRDLDPMRAQILVGRMFREKKQDFPNPAEYTIKPFAELSEEIRTRIPSQIAERFETLRNWIELQRKNKALSPDQIVTDFFNDVLVRDGFRTDPAANLGIQKVLDSMTKFREVLDYLANADPHGDGILPGWEDYFELVGLGMINAKYYEELYAQPEHTVLISLTSAYLSMNRPVDYQIWLNVGAPRWWERFYGELTNDAVLSRQWIPEKKWDTLTASAYNDAHMMNQIRGLLRRCRKQVKAYSSELSEAGQEQKSRLLYVFSDLARRFQYDKPTDPVPDIEFIPELREDEAVYPGISDAPSIQQQLKEAGALPNWEAEGEE